jgi:hypothetical protein
MRVGKLKLDVAITAALATDPDRARWNGRSLRSGDLAKFYGFTDLDGSPPELRAMS